MKKTIIIELTEEEKNFIKTCPPEPCSNCVNAGCCCGCNEYKDYRKRIEHVDREVVKLGQTYLRVKALGKMMDEIKKDQEELLQHLRDCGVEV